LNRGEKGKVGRGRKELGWKKGNKGQNIQDIIIKKEK